MPKITTDRKATADLDAAAEMATRYNVSLTRLAGKRIRVLRAVVYEGPAEAVMTQLARSLPVGTRDCGKYTITVIDNGAVKVLEDA